MTTLTRTEAAHSILRLLMAGWFLCVLAGWTGVL